jgi:hypothetical protein
MEVYILDSLRRTISVVDKYESIVWTERFSAYGDFEWHLHSTLDNRSRLTAGLWLVIEVSYRVMVIETVEDTTDEEGRDILIVRGRSIEAIMLSRLARSAMSNLTATPKWSITDQPADIARKYFHDICVTGVLNAGDVIAGVTESRMPLLPTDTISEPSDTVTFEIDPMTLYDATKRICDIYLMGFRFVRHPTTWALYYDIYMGSDRTTNQTALPAVVFSTSMDNLSNTTELTSIALYKNVAYVLSPVGSETVYADDVSSSIAGFDRNVLFVVADDITSGVPATATAQMIQRGKEELAKYRRFTAFDGELNQNSQYRYGTDYNLGDLVEFQNEEGTSSLMKVTEQIFVSDKNGDRSYPTLVIDSFITPGSWDDYAPDGTWDAQGASLHWDDL